MNKLGKLGNYPNGKMSADDEGELAFQLGWAGNGCLVINFGTPVVWLAMPPDQAKAFATSILEVVNQQEH